LRPYPELLDPIKNIIFDFGGVLIDIDYHRCVRSFEELGFRDFGAWYSQQVQHHLFDDFETGAIGPEEFRSRIRTTSGLTLSDTAIDDAWNSILTGMPEKNVRLLERLRPHYRLFLLSNTNAIHEKAFTDLIVSTYGKYLLPSLFDRIYLSHHMHMRKPHEEIFRFVLEENGLLAAETLFIDDSLQHVEGAARAGLRARLLQPGEDITSLF
jgi:FMN phosphatase YigB (HAD superfamily)